MKASCSYFSYWLHEFKSLYQQTWYWNRRNNLDVAFIPFKWVSQFPTSTFTL